MNFLKFMVKPFLLLSSVLSILYIWKGDFETTGCIGDTIGGTTAPFIGLISIYYLYKTLKEQQQFNQMQRVSNNAQMQLIKDEQFKSTFFLLLQEQRDILKSLQTSCPTLDSVGTKVNVHKVSGQDFFMMAIYEIRLLFDAMEMPKYQNDYNMNDASDLMQHVYEGLYQGVNLPQELEEENKRNVDEVKSILRQQFVFDKFKIVEKEFVRYKSMMSEEKIRFVYSKFFARYENCGYYFRHLYRILKYIEIHKDEEMNSRNATRNVVDAKYNQYVQFLQSQMSQNEMLITYYNCFLFKHARELIVKYRLLENLSIESLLKEEHAKYAAVFGMKHRPVYK